MNPFGLSAEEKRRIAAEVREDHEAAKREVAAIAKRLDTASAQRSGLSPGPIPPGPLVPAAWFFGAFLLALAVTLLLTGCAATPLPAESCTPLRQRAFLAGCERAVLLECSRARCVLTLRSARKR